MASAITSPVTSVTMIEASTPRLVSKISALKHKAGITTSEATKECFQHSFGVKLSDIGGQNRWVLAGFALQTWQEDLKERIDELIRENEGEIYKGWSIRDTSMARHCWMLGYERRCAYPTVVISCNISAILRRIMRIIFRHDILKPKGFQLKGFPACDLRLLTMATSHQQREGTVKVNLKSLWGSLETLCGTEILVQGSDKPATLGGVIMLDDKYYGLTVAHVFPTENAASAEPQVIEQLTQLYDSDWAEESSSDDDDRGSEPESPSSSSPKQKKRAENSNVARSNNGKNTPLTATLDDNDIHQEGFDDESLRVVAISKDSFPKSGDCLYDDFDWALIELCDPKYHRVNAIVVPQHDTAERYYHLFSNSPKSIPPAGTVYIATRNGVLRGTGTGSACAVKLPNSDNYRSVWTVEVERDLGKSTFFPAFHLQ